MTGPRNFDCIAYTHQQRARMNAKIEELGWDGFFEWVKEQNEADPLWRHFLRRTPVAPVRQARKEIPQQAAADVSQDPLP